MILNVPKDIYPKVAVMKAAYQFTDVAYIYIQQSEQDYIIDITAKTATDRITEEEFKNELLSQAVRYELYKQTQDVRQLIITRALASTIVGEQKEIIQPSQEFSEDDILKDWFDNDRPKI